MKNPLLTTAAVDAVGGAVAHRHPAGGRVQHPVGSNGLAALGVGLQVDDHALARGEIPTVHVPAAAQVQVVLDVRRHRTGLGGRISDLLVHHDHVVVRIQPDGLAHHQPDKIRRGRQCHRSISARTSLAAALGGNRELKLHSDPCRTIADDLGLIGQPHQPARPRVLGPMVEKHAGHLGVAEVACRRASGSEAIIRPRDPGGW